MRPLKSLTLEAIVDLLAITFGDVDDSRAAEQLSYSLHDTLMSGFAVMFFQHASLLQFQRAMAKKRQRCNLQTIFGVHAIPSDTQMREILDEVEPESIRSVLPQLWEKVRRAGWGGRFSVRIVCARPIPRAGCTIPTRLSEQRWCEPGLIKSCHWMWKKCVTPRRRGCRKIVN
jgi:hypothetical protein